MPGRTRDWFPSEEDYLAARYPSDADRREAEVNAADYAARMPEAVITAAVAERGVGPGTLVTTYDGGKGYAHQWIYDADWTPIVLVRFALVPTGADHDLRADYYAPAELTPVWGQP